MRKGFFRSILATVCAALLAAPTGMAQSSGQSAGQSGSQAGGQGSGGQGSAAPSGGISGGAAPIETTLFAYRALQSDAEEIAAKIVNSRVGDRIVIGAQPDISAFLQWRTIIGQADLMTSQLSTMHSEFAYLNRSYQRSTPLAALSITKKHSGKFTKGGKGSYTILVSNSPAASVTAGSVIVSDTPPDGLTIASMAGNGWACNPPSSSVPANSCTRTDALGPGATFDPITVTVNVASDAPDSVTNTATVAGGGSATASASDVTSLIKATTTTHNGGRGGAAVPFDLLVAPSTSDTNSGGTGAGSATPPTSPFSTALSAIPTLTSLVQFIATSFAVNQTLLPWQGSMTDMPLINAVAGVLRSHGRTVFVPATYPPLSMTDRDLYHTYLWEKITSLRDARVALWRDLENANALLMDVNFVIQNPTKYSAGDLNNALEYAGKAQTLLVTAQALAAGADTFVANLFGVQTSSGGAAPALASATGGSSTSGGNSSGASTPTSGSAGSASSGSSSGSAATPSATPANGGGAQNSSSGGAASSQTPIALLQILASDFLAQRIFNSKSNIDVSDINSINFLTLHALESGGSELVKTNIFYGTHIFFSGGSVATFSLYRLQGELQCSGTAFNYIGNVREKDVEHRLMVDDIRHPPKIAGFSCADMKESAQRGPVYEGMTRSEVESAFGKPDKEYGRRNFYLYKSRYTVVEFQNGVVIKIMAAEPQQSGAPF